MHSALPKSSLETVPPSAPVTTHGSAEVTRVPLWVQSSLPLQTSLKINAPGDKYEQEADSVAEPVMRMPTNRTITISAYHQTPNKMSVTPFYASETPLQRKDAKAKWAGSNVKISEEILPLLQGIFGTADAEHLRLRGKRLQVNLRHVSSGDPYRWCFLTEIIQSGEQLVITLSDTYSYAWHHTVNGTITSEETTESLPIDGVTLASKSLIQQGRGRLEGMTSQEENVSYIYLRPSMVNANKMAHELLGHFYLDMRGVPSGHPDMLRAEHNILDPTGTPFVGQVHDLIEKHIELDEKIEPYVF